VTNNCFAQLQCNSV